MPGETLDDALDAAQILRGKKIGTVFTHLGETLRMVPRRSRLPNTISELWSTSEKKGCKRRFPSN